MGGGSMMNLRNVALIGAVGSSKKWEILLRSSGRKPGGESGANFGNPGTASFRTATASSTGASSRKNIGDGVGLYDAFFTKTKITKIAFVDGTGTLADPTTHTNYLIYDLVESTGDESIYQILLRLDTYQMNSSDFANNDSVWPNPSVLNHSAGTNGYSGLLTASGGTGFSANSGGIPGRFVVMGINRDSDNDIQALCAFTGNLQSGKGDSWRGESPSQTFWSYWGQDFYNSSSTRRIGNSKQTSVGVAQNAAWTGNVYLLGY